MMPVAMPVMPMAMATRVVMAVAMHRDHGVRRADGTGKGRRCGGRGTEAGQGQREKAEKRYSHRRFLPAAALTICDGRGF